MAKITAVCLSTTLQRTITFKQLIPEQVNRSEKYHMYASGKAVNSARVLNQLESGCADVVCPLGERNAQRFLELAEEDGLQIHGISIPGYIRECWTLLDRSDHGTTELVVNEPVSGKCSAEQAASLYSAVSQCMKKSDALLLAGSRPDIWPLDMSAQICRIASVSGKTVMADFWGPDLQRTLQICTPQIIKINEEEFCGTFGYGFPLGEAELKECICRESRKYGNIIVVTRGTQMTFAADKGILHTQPVEKVAVVNSTACGDSFSAGFLYEYLKAGNMQLALEKGTWCAARNAERECPGAVR